MSQNLLYSPIRQPESAVRALARHRPIVMVTLGLMEEALTMSRLSPVARMESPSDVPKNRMSTTAITPSSSASSTSVLHWLPPVSALNSEKTVSRPVMDTLDEKPMTARLIVYRPVFEMMPARMLSTPRRVWKKAVMKPESIPAAMAAGSARSGCPAMVSIAPTAQPSVKQPSVDRSAMFRMEKLMNSASATRP